MEDRGLDTATGSHVTVDDRVDSGRCRAMTKSFIIIFVLLK